MDVPSEYLEVLKCDNCHDYLSYSPVYLKHNGFTLCGRCFVSEENSTESANRILQYEAAAKLLKFPCRHRIYGCKETVPFSDDDQEKNHEEGCEFRHYNCPISSEVQCTWFGKRIGLQQHFQAKHPSNIASNPCHLIYDIAHFASRTYISHCFNAVFLIHTKVCIASGKIYHAVQLLDNPEKLSQFKYVLDIKRGDLVISRPGKVMPQRIQGIDDNLSVVTNISSMLDFLDGFSGTIFTVTIQQVFVNIPQPPSIPKAIPQPTIVPKPITQPANVPQSQKKNEPPKPSTSASTVSEDRFCRNQQLGCTFSDSLIKCEKHEDFFCPFRGWCWLCWAPINVRNSDAWYAHILNAHEIHIFQGGTNFSVTPTSAVGRSVLVRTTIGLAYCRYIYQTKFFVLYIWSPATNKNLKRYTCRLGITEPVSGHSETFLLDKQFNETWDWKIKIEKDSLPYWNSRFDVNIQVAK